MVRKCLNEEKFDLLKSYFKAKRNAEQAQVSQKKP